MVTSASHWCVPLRSKGADVLEIGYGRDAHFPQVAALHIQSSYLRLTTGTEMTWGTSVVLLPVVWEAGHSHPTQGAPIQITSCKEEAKTLVLEFTGSLAGLVVTGRLRFSPPTPHRLTVKVAVRVAGMTPLETAHGAEALKTMMLSSMHVSPDLWDTSHAFVGRKTMDIPASPQWVVPPSLHCHTFGLRGGRSQWQRGKVAPALVISSSERLLVAGWVSSPGRGSSGGPNSDNVALWAAHSQVQTAWHYTVTARI